MKQLESKQVEINGITYYIFPFPAFKAANLSGKLVALLSPILGGLAAIVGKNDGAPLDMDIEQALPKLADAISVLDGDKVEQVLKSLLLGNNISVEYKGTDKTEKLTEDIANELFCGEMQDMLQLAIEVVKVNYSGFFQKLQLPFGTQKEVLGKMTSKISMENSTQANSVS